MYLLTFYLVVLANKFSVALTVVEHLDRKLEGWGLPTELCDFQSLTIFKCNLKTHLISVRFFF